VSKQAFDDSVYFLRRFIRQPRHIASVWPSSRQLTARMFADLDLRAGDLLLEYGPGTGSFTVEVERMRQSGIAVRYLGIEKDPGMYQFLLRRFPCLDFVQGDAADVVDICRARHLPRAAAVISGLPMIFIDRPSVEDIFAGTGQCLNADGVFRTFSYVHSYPSRSAGELRDLMDLCFESYDLSTPVLRNLPPAFVLTGRGPRTMEAPAELELAMARVPEQGFSGH
jgi:phosphatidylethanolamine/phosphatidyl-N-methylethanolamine N-methyltransferase